MGYLFYLHISYLFFTGQNQSIVPCLASGLGPLLVLRVWQKPVTAPVAIAMMLVGIGTALTWIELKLSDGLNEALPGMAAGMAVYLIAKLFTSTRVDNKEINKNEA